ncbi:hypothetical protein BY996DRAFT_4578053 [Phakopsora pachyrhizi]|uniref:Pali-domain-containing protein n=1 Tax=Phakopsora pachyrhizi TaxID=170000 RepID=A0AAV0AF47_PHAPC|nr:hypothetical protein BY996DRAFT_4578053 [Phakopsora pachyrhizi]CAH7665853.1 hypothetical protein PPACK8108_LOCUS146 [Phakopsora pachyrhizi]
MNSAATVSAGLSFIFLLIGTILMIASSCASPTSEEIYFLKTQLSPVFARGIAEYLPRSVFLQNRLEIKLGILGYCINNQCTDYHLGYRLPAFLFGGPFGIDILEGETTSQLAINPLFTAFSCLSVLVFIVLTFFRQRAIVLIFLILNSALGLITLIIDLNIFVRAHSLIRTSEPGYLRLVIVNYGSALWMMIAAFCLILISTLIFCVTLKGGSSSISIKRKSNPTHDIS